MTGPHGPELAAARHAETRQTSSPDGQIRVLGWLASDSLTDRHRHGLTVLSRIVATAAGYRPRPGLLYLRARLPGLNGEELGWIGQQLWPAATPPGAADRTHTRPPAGPTTPP